MCYLLMYVKTSRGLSDAPLRLFNEMNTEVSNVEEIIDKLTDQGEWYCLYINKALVRSSMYINVSGNFTVTLRPKAVTLSW